MFFFILLLGVFFKEKNEKVKQIKFSPKSKNIAIIKKEQRRKDEENG